MFWTRFEAICQQNGFTPNGIAKELGIPSGSITAWKSGAKPRANTVVKIAKRFNVSVSYLLGESDTKEKDPAVSDEADEITKELYSIWSTASEEERAMLLDMARVIKSRRKKD